MIKENKPIITACRKVLARDGYTVVKVWSDHSKRAKAQRYKFMFHAKAKAPPKNALTSECFQNLRASITKLVAQYGLTNKVVIEARSTVYIHHPSMRYRFSIPERKKIFRSIKGCVDTFTRAYRLEWHISERIATHESYDYLILWLPR